MPRALTVAAQSEISNRKGAINVRIIAVMSGKGGVGKSFVATGLAAALQRRTGAVGVLDADIIGASVPHLLGVPRGAKVDADGKFIPGVGSDGIKVASMSLMLPADNKAVIWRGPMISNAIGQLYNDTLWGDTEYLVVDLPPGTSDAALTVLQTIQPDGIVVVTTPQDMVTNIAHHAQDMADAIGTKVIGLVMNMAYVMCPHCDERINVFGSATEVPEDGPAQLATLPLVPEWAALADSGRAAETATEKFDALAERVLSEIAAEESAAI